MTGVAFETRLSEGHAPNRTMSSYVEGKKKKTGDSCLVRGFWGDIINSPYIPLGIEVMNEADRKNFEKEYNFQRPYNSCDVAEYHIENYTTKLETLMDYVAPFEIIRNIENAKSKSKKKDEDNKIEEVKEEDEEDKEPPKKSKVEGIKATGEAEENKEAKEKENDNEEDNKNEESKGDKIIRDEQKSKQLLEGFKRLNVKIHLMTGKMSSFYQKSKYKKLFNIVVLSMRCSDRLKKEFNELLADGCYIHIENGNKLVIFDDKNKHDFIVKLKEYTKEANWKELADNYNHHCSFQYLGDDAKIPDYNPIPEYVEDKTNTLPSPDTFSADESTASMTNLTEESMNNEKVEY